MQGSFKTYNSSSNKVNSNKNGRYFNKNTKYVEEEVIKSKKQIEYEATFSKYASLLSKEYKDQFKRTEATVRSEKDNKLKEAMRTGKTEVVVKDSGNKQNTPLVDISKVLDPNTTIEIKTVPYMVAQQVAKHRAMADLTQDQLATKISEKVSILKELEAGTGVYNPKVLDKIEKVLGVNITRPRKS
jgi:putative transcription factor